MADESKNPTSTSLSDKIAITALVVSLFAMLVIIFQLTQAVYATARGLPNSGKRVMGRWAGHKHRKLRWFFRIEVQYEAPAVFLARSDNKKGPVGDHDRVPIWYADGTPRSCLETRTPEPIAEEDYDPANIKFTPEAIRTVNNELATWVTLLGAIQKMERDSKNWEAMQWRETRTPMPELPKVTTLAVGIQSMRRSFDSHPDIKRPYATTTICHLVELAAVLGLYWKEFNRDKNRYRAEGNGYSLLGTRLGNFGIVFVFERTGRPKFKEIRVIPTCEVKELCFGNVPTFYRPKGPIDEAAWGVPFNEQRDLQTLHLGSRKEIAETLNLIGCNTQTLLYYLRERRKHIHLFPVTFEIVGMLGRTLHIENRCFTYLPNPTIFPWHRQSFSLRRLLKAFHSHLSEEIQSFSKEQVSIPQELQEINAQAELLDRDLPGDLDNNYAPPLLNKLHRALDVVDNILDENKISKKIVLDVLRRHLQEVLLAINTSATNKEEGGDPPSKVNTPTTTRASTMQAEDKIENDDVLDIVRRHHLQEKGEGSGVVPNPEMAGANISFDELLGIPPENRETEFMKIYFDEIRLRVISTDSNSHHDPQAADASKAIHKDNPQQQQPQGQPQNQNQHQQDDQLQGELHNQNHSSPPSPIASKGRTLTIFSPASRNGTNLVKRADTFGTTQEKTYELPRNNIWCALVFRMICWLLLHDFDKKDIQLPKSELMGSRQSVYIM